MLLSVNDLHVYYGAIHAVKGVSLEVNEGEIVTLIGANGAGKSTVLNTISGLLRAKTGTIEFMGTPINTMAPNKIVQLGLKSLILIIFFPDSSSLISVAQKSECIS